MAHADPGDASIKHNLFQHLWVTNDFELKGKSNWIEPKRKERRRLNGRSRFPFVFFLFFFFSSFLFFSFFFSSSSSLGKPR